jgi:ADP-ribose pyrophosphatase
MSNSNDDKDRDRHLSETRIDGKVVYEGSFFQVQRDTVRQPDGRITAREYIRHPGAVVILPLFDDGTVLLERQFRYPLKQVFIEFPAGKIDPGENTLVCAKRELQEETGFSATDWQSVCTIHNALGYSDEHLEIFLARGLVAGKNNLDDGELIEVFRAPLSDLLEWVRTGKVTDVKTVVGAFWLEKITAGQWQV